MSVFRLTTSFLFLVLPSLVVSANTPADQLKEPGSATAEFRHPGVLLNRGQLDLIKQRVAEGIEPQKTAFATMMATPLAALDYVPKPRETIECGPRSNPDIGCKDERRDAMAAYSHAIAWIVTGNADHARTSIRIMNAWATTLKGGHKMANGPVQAAWAGSVWPRAAEIIRHTFTGWAAEEIAQFKQMLLTQYVPSLVGGSTENGNKELAMSEALMNIGVFADDRALFEAGVKMWRGRTPAYIYLERDGPTPILPPSGETPFWTNKGKATPLVNGLLQESMRDPHHANMGFSSIVNAAETARQQGLDLYAEHGDRIVAAMEFQAQFLAPNNTPVPEFLEFTRQPTWEIAYNHFHHRLGLKLPLMAKVIPTNRPTGADNNHMVWETLTHGDVGPVGLPPLNPAQ